MTNHARYGLGALMIPIGIIAVAFGSILAEPFQIAVQVGGIALGILGVATLAPCLNDMIEFGSSARIEK